MLKSNAVNRIIALVAALVIWAYVIVVENPPQTTEIRDVPVNLINMDSLMERKLTVSSEASFTVSLTISGKRADLAKLTVEDFNAVADMRGFQRGIWQVPVTVDGPGSVSIKEIRPAKLNVNFEDMISVSKPIIIEYTDEFEENSEPGFIKMVPDQIEVSGAKSQVDGVSYIQVLVDNSSLQASEKVFRITPQPINDEGRQIYAPLKLSQSEVEVSLTLCKVKEVRTYVPVIGAPDTMYEVTNIVVPSKVKIRGTEAALDQVNFLNAEVVDLSGVDLTSRIPVVFKDMPLEVELAAESEDLSVDVTIKGIATNEFTYAANEIEMEGVREGFGAYINDSSIKIRVYGISDVIKDLEKADVIPYVDLTDIDRDEDTAYVPIQIRYERELRKVEVIPEKVLVNIYEYYS